MDNSSPPLTSGKSRQEKAADKAEEEDLLLTFTISAPAIALPAKNCHLEGIVKALKDRKFQRAIELLNRARFDIPAEPSIPRLLAYAYAAYGFELVQAKKYEDAIQQLVLANYYDAENPDYIAGLGHIYLRIGEQNLAYEAFNRALNKDERNTNARIGLGEIYYLKGELEQAMEMFEYAASIMPENKAILKRLNKLKKEASTEKDFFRQESLHFIIKSDRQQNQHSLGLIQNLLENVYREITNTFDYYPRAEIPVIIYSDRDFSEITRSPDWAGAVYDGKIRLPGKGVVDETEKLKSFLAHEITHAVLHSLCGDNIPTWLNEGLAQYEEGKRIDQNAISFIEKLRTNRLLPLRNLTISFLKVKDTKTAQFLYQQSLAVVEYMRYRYRNYEINNLLVKLGKGYSMDQALEEELSIDEEKLLAEAIKYWKNQLDIP